MKQTYLFGCLERQQRQRPGDAPRGSDRRPRRRPRRPRRSRSPRHCETLQTNTSLQPRLTTTTTMPPRQTQSPRRPRPHRDRATSRASTRRRPPPAAGAGAVDAPWRRLPATPAVRCAARRGAAESRGRARRRCPAQSESAGARRRTAGESRARASSRRESTRSDCEQWQRQYRRAWPQRRGYRHLRADCGARPTSAAAACGPPRRGRAASPCTRRADDWTLALARAGPARMRTRTRAETGPVAHSPPG